VCRIHGIAPSQAPETLKEAFEFIHPDDRPRLQQGIQRLFETQIYRDTEYRIVRPDGEQATLWSRVQLRLSSSGKPERIIGTVTDISERKNAEEQRRNLEAQIQHAQNLESLGVLAGGVAHDFNNLLTGVLGYASLARKHLSPSSQAEPMLQEIERGAERAADLAQQMLAYSGPGKFIVRTIPLDALVGEMSKLLQTVVSKKAALQLDLLPAIIDGDATQVRQVVMNLITNASDALGGREGIIAVRTGVRWCERSSLAWRHLPNELPEGTYAFVEVQDRGCGMTEETLQRIFDPFFTSKFAGRGLGLAAVLGIVRGHHGTIQVASSLGKGTKFQVLFPRSTAAESAAPVVSTTLTQPKAKGTILVVEDEESVSEFVRLVLEEAGFQVRVAAHGREGLKAFELNYREVVGVVLDLTMPEMDGLELAHRIRHMRTGVPILLMSGYSELETLTRLAEIGAAGFLQKPIRPDELITRDSSSKYSLGQESVRPMSSGRPMT
jgi:PAS domain S-box-containing protein